MTRHRCYIPDMDGAIVRVPDEQAHHLVHVLRLGAGDELIVFDGRGGEWLARIVSATRNSVTLERTVPRLPLAEPPVAVTLAVGLLKGDQMSTIVRDVTALGAAAIVPFVSAHVAVPSQAWRTRAIDRWLRIAASAAAQCGRAVVPVVRDVVRFDELVGDSAYDARWMCVEPARQPAHPAQPDDTSSPRTAVVIVGPEGGWSDEEITRAHAAGTRWLHLGPRTLRAELAPTVALSVLWTKWGWGQPKGDDS